MRRYRCLVVEDSKTMRNMLAESLARIPGMEVVEADNGLSGIRALAKQQFDLVVTDLNMPVMDGLKLIRHVRGDPRHEKTPVVIITTESAPNDRDRAMALGANAYIEKPIQAPRVIRAVKKLLEV
ncbi:MAG TPA: response regulator [Polyangiales bacterium]|nr:response regulator [Polyangiales bacterium]